MQFYDLFLEKQPFFPRLLSCSQPGNDLNITEDVVAIPGPNVFYQTYGHHKCISLYSN